MCSALLICCSYLLELFDGQTDKSKGDNITSQDAGHIENNDFVKTSNRQAVLIARGKINELVKNNTLTVLFTIF